MATCLEVVNREFRGREEVRVNARYQIGNEGSKKKKKKRKASDKVLERTGNEGRKRQRWVRRKRSKREQQHSRASGEKGQIVSGKDETTEGSLGQH